MDRVNEELVLFHQYFEQNDVWKANVLIKNIFNKHMDHLNVFQTFYEFCIKIAGWNIDIPTRKMFLEQASSALVFFSENTSLTPDVLDMIQACQHEMDKVSQQIHEVEELQYEKKLEDAKKQQTEYLRLLTEYKYAIVQSTEETGFQELLEKVKQVEEQINSELLDDREKELYIELTKDYPNVISKKLAEFERLKVKNYNQRAVKDFHNVFHQFQANEEKYKNSMFELKRLVSSKLFSYDSNKLVNETLIYYNHVYSYIFGKLDDHGKYKLTEFAIEMEKAN